LSVRAQRERQDQLDHERVVLRMREAVVSAVAPGYLHRVGSSAVFEAVDEALAQIVAAGHHRREPEQVKALWITCARRRLIDDQRSAESKHRGARPAGEAEGLPDERGSDLTQLTEDSRQWWRIREILGVLRGDQRLWAEAWYDQVLSASRPRGGQPRGLPEALGWTPSKTKSVSRRARLKMAAFIDDRASGAVCRERRALLDEFILAGRRPPTQALDEERYAAVLFHVAGCPDCWAAWHARRRSLLGRCSAIALLPVDAATSVGHAISAKVAGLAVGAYGQASSLLARLGVGGAAAGGGAATLGGKATAVCVGVVCAATAGGELAGVLKPIAPDPVHQKRAVVAKPKPKPAPKPQWKAPKEVVRRVTTSAPATTAAAVQKAAVRQVLTTPRTSVARGTPGDLPWVRTGGSSTTDATPTATPRVAPPAAADTSRSRSTCVPGSLGC
jgi:DNA-directed RNA polymerase specialized sigma24 family protein